LHGAPLCIVFWWIHGDEHFHREAFRGIAKDDDRLGGKQVMVFIDEQDVLIASHRPERTEWTVFLEVHRGFITQSLEIGPPLPLPVQKRIAHVNVINS